MKVMGRKKITKINKDKKDNLTLANKSDVNIIFYFKYIYFYFFNILNTFDMHDFQ